MVRLAKEYEEVVQFRRRGFTYSEIARIVGVSKSTVAKWLKEKDFSKRVTEDNAARAAKDNRKRMRMLNKTRANEHKRLRSETKRSAELEYKHFKQSPLFIAGVMAYLSHGDMQKDGPIRLTTTNQDVHRIFCKFMREYGGISSEDIRFWLLLYPDCSETACERRWLRALKLTKQQCYKHQRVAGTYRTKTLHHGVGNTIIGNAILKQRLCTWVALASKEL